MGEFRDHLAKYLSSTTPIAVTCQGQTVGYFLPARPELVDIVYKDQIIYIKYILTHAEYDKDEGKNDPYFEP
ncbi:hypothetical protein MAE30S32_09010 [Microcystis aeruginosa 11-30S32]|uniref:Prevent-host-death protein n=1 Tax=Microcystis aeruginosa 11-30S32 TaxID=2358142 RepID=A0A510PEM5_MICAE|nr:hypothetical protein MAE30S32_09010 [Microcystis aeruginosa 11-30S32]